MIPVLCKIRNLLLSGMEGLEIMQYQNDNQTRAEFFTFTSSAFQTNLYGLYFTMYVLQHHTTAALGTLIDAYTFCMLLKKWILMVVNIFRKMERVDICTCIYIIMIVVLLNISI